MSIEQIHIKKVLGMVKNYGIYLALFLLVGFFSALTEGKFQRPNNILNVVRQVSMMGIASVGMAFVLLLGGIDLSIGSTITLVNITQYVQMVIKGSVLLLAVGFDCYQKQRKGGR
jgi:ribose transport system permease protein